MDSEFKGKVVLITGSAGQIGIVIAKLFAKRGASVVMNYNSSKDDNANAALAEVSKFGKAIMVKADVAKSTDAKKLFDEAEKAFGKVDVLINNAGRFMYKPLEACTDEDDDAQLNDNFKTIFIMTREAGNRMKPGSTIINMTSSLVEKPTPGTSLYSATKAAAEIFTKVSALELLPKKIRVNAVAPGFVGTETNLKYFKKEGEAQTPLGRMGTPEEIAESFAFLAGEKGQYYVGEIFRPNGGFCMH